MLSWAIRFLIVATVAALIALSDIAAEAAMVAKVVVAVFLGLCTVSLIAGLRRRGE